MSGPLRFLFTFFGQYLGVAPVDFMIFVVFWRFCSTGADFDPYLMDFDKSASGLFCPQERVTLTRILVFSIMTNFAYPPGANK